MITSVVAPPINENDFESVSGSFSDVGTLDTHDVLVTWSDGSATFATVNSVARTFSATSPNRVLDDDPTGTPQDTLVDAIKVEVVDDDTGSDEAFVDLVVINLDPEITGLFVDPIDENEVAVVTGTFSDVGTLDTHTVLIDWGDGSPLAPATVDPVNQTFTASRQFLDDDPTGTPQDTYVVKAFITDDDTGKDDASVDLVVSNVPPEITSFGTDSPFCGGAAQHEVVTATLEFVDPGTLDTHEVVVDWGDGNTDTISLTNGERLITSSHVYLSGGVFTVTVALTDDDDGASVALGETTVLVSGAGVVGDTLYVIGTDEDDQVTINQTGNGANGVYKVHTSFLDPPPRDFPKAGIDHVTVILCPGDDHATISSKVGIPAIIDGGEGDKLTGSSGEDWFTPGVGDLVRLALWWWCLLSRHQSLSAMRAMRGRLCFISLARVLASKTTFRALAMVTNLSHARLTDIDVGYPL